MSVTSRESNTSAQSVAIQDITPAEMDTNIRTSRSQVRKGTARLFESYAGSYSTFPDPAQAAKKANQEKKAKAEELRQQSEQLRKAAEELLQEEGGIQPESTPPGSQAGVSPS